ncbi:MAG TPA: hypothetical protein VGY55_18205 [Pirellulales bacterium]|jgi:hypothetical protein|nr:hypothetical protein [Pirellulales bacterium]
MHSVELLEEALDAARRIGFQIREEWFGGNGGGACTVRGRKFLFLDLNLSTRDRLEQVLDALRADPQTAEIMLTATLRRVLEMGKAA